MGQAAGFGDRRFPSGCVASPHHLATAAGAAVLSGGGNAVDAAVATNLVLAVVMPGSCGLGGDLFAMVWRDGEGPVGYNGSGKAAAAASLKAVREAAGSQAMPVRGPLAVTVPGVVEAWFALLQRYGTRSFTELAAPAVRLAASGFPLSRFGAASIADAESVFTGSPVFEEWRRTYAGCRPGKRLVQPGIARTLEALSEEGPDAYYRGDAATAIADTVIGHGGFLAVRDLSEHHGDWVDPLSTVYRGVRVFEMPPNTQGVTALEALNIVEEVGPMPPGGVERQHLLIEAMKVALADRDALVTDPEHMAVAPSDIASRGWAIHRLATIDRFRARDPAPVESAVPGGDTVYLCAADSHGTMVSLIQSNFNGFGSGLTVPGWGVNLQNRGASFSLDEAHVNVIGPRKRTMHTLAPAMASKSDEPWLAFGSMGAHGQAQIHLQLLARIVDEGEDLQHAIDAPRWVVVLREWSIRAESRFPSTLIQGLREMGHTIEEVGPFEEEMGWAQAIARQPGGYSAASDPRSEGAALGV